MDYFYIYSIVIFFSILFYGYYSKRINTDTLIHKLTYNKDLKHSLINYGLILLGLFCYQSSIGFKTLVAGSIFQLLVLVFIKQSGGVSLVWSTLLGLALLSCKTNKERAYLIAALIVVLYYAFTFPFITSLGHVVTALLAFFILKFKTNI